MIINVVPAIVMISGALVLPFLSKKLKSAFAIFISALTFYVITQLQTDSQFMVSLLNFDLEFLRVDKLSKAFGYIFTLSATVAFKC